MLHAYDAAQLQLKGSFIVHFSVRDKLVLFEKKMILELQIFKLLRPRGPNKLDRSVKNMMVFSVCKGVEVLKLRILLHY